MLLTAAGQGICKQQNQWRNVVKNILWLIAALILIIVLPISIKTEYNLNFKTTPEINLEIAAYGNNGVLVKWETENENDIAGYKIQRLQRSAEYITVGYVPAMGTNSAYSYTFVDQPQGRGIVRYRLQVVEKTADSRQIYSRETVFNYTPQARLTDLQTRPLKNGLEIEFYASESLEATINILSSSGDLIRNLGKVAFATGHHQVSWDFRNANKKRIMPGVYFVQMEAGDQTLTSEVNLLQMNGVDN